VSEPLPQLFLHGLAQGDFELALRGSWARVLRDLFARGIKPWKITVADGHPGIWSR